MFRRAFSCGILRRSLGSLDLMLILLIFQKRLISESLRRRKLSRASVCVCVCVCVCVRAMHPRAHILQRCPAENQAAEGMGF